MTATGRAAPGGRRRPGWALPDATAPTAALAASLLGLILVGALAGGLLRQAGPTGMVDQPTASFVAAHRHGWLDGVMRLVTDLGSAGVLVPLVLSAGLAWRWRRGTWRPLALLAGAVAGAWVVQVAVKQLVERPRPPAALALSHASGFAFPSGHATDAAAVYGMLAVLLARSGRGAAKVAAWAGAAALIALVGLSRLYLGVHWLSDVVAGAALGSAWLLAILIAGRVGEPRRHRVGWVLLAAAMAMVLVMPEAVEGLGAPVHAAAAPLDHPARKAARRPAPRVTRVVLVIEENHEFGQIIGSRRAPFLNRLAAHATLLTRYYAITHPSLPNYVALLAGSPLGIHGDCRQCHRPGRNLVDQLDRAHISWKAYYQSLPAPCSAVVRAGAYAKKTNPFAHLDDVRASPARCHRVVPLDRLRPDLRRGRLPRFVVIVPDLRHDMHSGPVGEADDFLRRLDRELATSSSWRPGTVLVVTFDEGTTSRGLHGRGGGHVATVVTGPGVRARQDATPYTHYALLRSIEHRFGLPPLRNAADPATRTIPAIAGPRRPT
ncbi:MAG TPA: alkaline phosphatase family protein [Actinomycetota bacterium]|nr:alkaline phosphatase family protein [Actinomycetota bacterium]